MVNKVATTLVGYIEYFDSMRPPRNYLSAFKSAFVFYRNKDLKKHDTNFYQDIRGFRDYYFWKESRNVLILLLSPILIFLVFAGFLGVALFMINTEVSPRFYDLFLRIFKITSALMIGGYLFFAAYTLRTIYLRDKGVIGQELDNKVKETIQKIIDYTRDYFKKNRINAMNFRVKLRHNDYEGLKYEEKGKNKYIAYVVVE